MDLSKVLLHSEGSRYVFIVTNIGIFYWKMEGKLQRFCSFLCKGGTYCLLGTLTERFCVSVGEELSVGGDPE